MCRGGRRAPDVKKGACISRVLNRLDTGSQRMTTMTSGTKCSSHSSRSSTPIYLLFIFRPQANPLPPNPGRPTTTLQKTKTNTSKTHSTNITSNTRNSIITNHPLTNQQTNRPAKTNTNIHHQQYQHERPDPSRPISKDHIQNHLSRTTFQEKGTPSRWM